MVIHSLINFIGHKSKIVDQIKPYFPAKITGTFYDVFAGSAVVALNVNYPSVVCTEINPYLVGLYQDLSDSNFSTTLSDLITRYGLTNSSVVPRSRYLQDPNIGTCTWMGKTIPNLHLDQLNKPGYTKLLEDFNNKMFTGLEQSAAYMIATVYGRNSGVATDLTTGRLSGAVGPLDYSVRCSQKLTEHQQVLSQGRHTFVNASYNFITPTKDDFVYIDPPYLASGFKYSGWTEQDERDLLAWIDSLPCPWALSNTLQSGKKVNTILEAWSKTKTVIDLDKKYRKWAGSGQQSAKKTTKVNREVLILPTSVNPTFGNGLFDVT